MQWLLESPCTPLGILLHLALSSSALQFHVPVKRMDLKPVIYREFLLHSLIFAARALMVMVVCYAQPFGHLYLRMAVVLLAHYLADLVTDKYGKYNPKTMRGMPYSNTPEWLEKRMFQFYSVSQLFATYACLNAHMDQVFLTVLPIQLAALLMTLARKKLISTTSWHVWYAGALALNWVYLFYAAYLFAREGAEKKDPEALMVAQVCQVVGFTLTVFWGFYGRRWIHKHVFWTVIGLIHAWQCTNYPEVLWGAMW